MIPVRYKPSDDKCLGISYSGEELKAARIRLSKGTVVIEELLEANVPLKPSDVNPLYIDPELKRIQQLSSEILSASSLGGNDYLLRRLKLKLTKQKEIDAAFLFQAEPLLPYPAEDAVVDKWTFNKQEGETALAFISAQKKAIEAHLEQINSIGLDPEALSADSVALTALAKYFSEPQSLQLLINIDKELTTCILIREGILIATHAISQGWRDLYNGYVNDHLSSPSSIAEFFSNDIESLVMEKNHETHLKWTAFQQLVEWTAISLLKETKIKESPKLLVTGEGANLAGIPQSLSRILELSLSALNAPCGIEKLNSFSIPLGLALSFTPAFKEKIDLRQEEFSFKAPWKRYKSPISIVALCALFLTFSLYLLNLSYSNFRENMIRERFLNVLTIAQKSYSEFEKQYEEKNKIEVNQEGIIPIENLSSEEIGYRLDALERQIKMTPDIFPLFPNVPRVSDLLAWLSNHPSFRCPEGTECPQVNIEAFAYSLVKRPEMNKKGEKYQAKVDLEFSTSSPRVAREFHDALITPNDLVDPKGEIKWNATKGKYKTSFFLKDKTFYPAPLKGGSA